MSQSSKHRRKKIRKVLGMVIFATVLAVFLCSGLELRKTGNRPYTPYPLSKELKERINQDVSRLNKPTDVAEYSCDLTTELLTFSEKNDIPHGKANCVGYAQLSSSIFNYAIAVLSKQKGEESYL